MGSLPTLVVMQFSSGVAYYVLFLIFDPGILVAGRHWFVLGVLSIVVLANYFVFVRALEIGPVSIVSSVVAAYAAIVVALAVLVLGERLNLGQGIGATIAIAGVFLASSDLRTLATGFRIGRGVVFAFIALVGFGITTFAGGVLAQSYGWLVPAFAVRLFTVPMIVAIAAARKAWPWRTAGIGMMAFASVVGVVEAGGFLAFMRGSELGFVAVVAAASATYPLIPLVLGMSVFKERLAPNQWVGVISVLAGVILLGVSGA